MANVIVAIGSVMRQEDAALSGVVTTDPGGRTRFGIAEKYHPWLEQIGFYTSMSASQAFGAAMVLYLLEYCQPLDIAAISDQAIATKLLSLSVNEGIDNPVKWLQEAVGAIPDGAIGPATIAALNKADPQKALAALKQQAIAWYEQLAKDNPADEEYLKGWINRANA